MRNIVLFILLFILLTLLFYFASGKVLIAQGNYIYVKPPVRGRLVFINDYIYFVEDIGTIVKCAKINLEVVDTVNIPLSYNIRYSDYLDKIIVMANSEPCILAFLDYDSMTVGDQIDFHGQVADVVSINNKLYVIWDNSGIGEGEIYDPFNLTRNTGRLTEMNLDNYEINWEIDISTLPQYIEVAGDYLVIRSREVLQFPDQNDYDTMYGGVIDIVGIGSLEVRKGYVAHIDQVGMKYVGNNLLYVTNTYWLPGYRGPDAGLSLIHLDTLDWEHIYLEAPVGVDYGWAASWVDLEGDDLFISYTNSSGIQGGTLFGKYDINTGNLETIEIPGINKDSIYIEVDGNDVYLVTHEGGLLKYTMD